MSTDQPISLTDQILATREREVKKGDKKYKKRYLAQHMQLIERLEEAVTATSTSLKQGSMLSEAEIVWVLDPTILVKAHYHDAVSYEAELWLDSEQYAAWVNGDVALVPDLGALVIATDIETDDEDTDVYWVVIDPTALLEHVSLGEFEDGSIVTERVQPLLDWLEQLRGDE